MRRLLCRLFAWFVRGATVAFEWIGDGTGRLPQATAVVERIGDGLPQVTTCGRCCATRPLEY